MAKSQVSRMTIISIAFVLTLAACASRPTTRGTRDNTSARSTARERIAARGARKETSARHAREKTSIIAGREVVVWAPTTGSAPQPVVIFSHGFGGCATQSRFLTEAIASHGYWVVAPNHKDARCGEGGGTGLRTEEPMKNPEQWTDATYADRGEDIRAILRALALLAAVRLSPHA